MSIPLSVLVIEDNPDDVTLLLRELRKGGYEADYMVIDDAVSMQTALQSKKWDIILCDFKLPQFSGSDALKILQKSGLDIPFIVVSGHIGEDAAVEILRSGANDVILKTSLKRLISAISRELQEAANRRKQRQVEEELAAAHQELKHSNELLKQYSRKITQIQEEERKRIAFELHDDTAQYLSILKMQINALIYSGKTHDPEVLEKLKYLERDADRAFNDVRRYSHELRPSVLDHMGLRASLEQAAEDLNRLGHFCVDVEVEGEEPELSEEVKLGLFRIAQEALNNTRKHAKAKKAVICLKFRDNWMSLRITDDGVGFDLQEIRARYGEKGSLGMVSMQERANLIKAALKIDSIPYKGTTVSVEMTL